MSHSATNWAIRQRGLHPATKLVLWHLCDRHNPDLGCFPSQERLAHDAEVSRSQLNVHLKRLEEAGLLRRESRRDPVTGKQLPTRYILGCEEDFTPIGGAAAGTDAEQSGAAPCPENRHGAVSDFGANPCPVLGENRVRKPDTNLVREPLREPLRRTSARGVGEGSFDEEDQRSEIPAAGAASTPAEPLDRTEPSGAEEAADPFDAFWAAYPEPVERRAAEAAWDKALSEGAAPDQIVAAARSYAASREVERGFVLKPANFLDRGRWRDAPATPAAPASKPAQSDPDAVARFWGAAVNEGRFVAPCAISPLVASRMVALGLVTPEQLRTRGIAA